MAPASCGTLMIDLPRLDLASVLHEADVVIGSSIVYAQIHVHVPSYITVHTFVPSGKRQRSIFSWLMLILCLGVDQLLMAPQSVRRKYPIMHSVSNGYLLRFSRRMHCSLFEMSVSSTEYANRKHRNLLEHGLEFFFFPYLLFFWYHGLSKESEGKHHNCGSDGFLTVGCTQSRIQA